MKYDNCIILFPVKKVRGKMPSMLGKIICEGREFNLALWQKTGDKGIFWSGITTTEDKVKTGDITIFTNRSFTPKVPEIKGYYKTGECEYIVSCWKKTKKSNGLNYYAGTIKIKNPEMIFRAESKAKLEAPESFDDTTF
jgi:hypothetical protein